MDETRFSLKWNASKTFCNGLTSLQQNGDFVDMTLAADGYFVKVHQVIIALASPYLREIMKSCDRHHPVLFLNKVSYQTLCSLLEYIYTGETLVNMDNLHDFVMAGKELHIRGIFEMEIQEEAAYNEQQAESEHNQYQPGVHPVKLIETNTLQPADTIPEVIVQDPINEMECSEKDTRIHSKKVEDIYSKKLEDSNVISTVAEHKPEKEHTASMQYTISTRGTLQMILNRYMYYLKYKGKDNMQNWRCVDYLTKNIKCPAYVVVKDNIVVKRVAAHVHKFHDTKILKKVQAGAVFKTIKDAENTNEAQQKIKQTTSSDDDMEDCGFNMKT